jgi:DNA-directed RNA polymerase subunit RPC12/RpoP
MSEFKYACPVCGQHMMCDSSQAGTVMECPTCFQKITAPQAPASDDAKFIITGTKVGERPVPKFPEASSSFVPAAKGFPGAIGCRGDFDFHRRGGRVRLSRDDFQIQKQFHNGRDGTTAGSNSSPAKIQTAKARSRRAARERHELDVEVSMA